MKLRIERLGRLVGNPVAGAGNDVHLEVRLQRAEEVDAFLDVGIGRRIELAPDAGERRLHLRQHFAERAGDAHVAAARLGARGVQDLHVDRHAVDVLRDRAASGARDCAAPRRPASAAASRAAACAAWRSGLRVAFRPPAPTKTMRLMRSCISVARWPDTMPPKEKPVMARTAGPWAAAPSTAVFTQCVTDQTSRTSSGGSLSPRPGRSAA